MIDADLGSTNSAFKYFTTPGPEKKVKKVNNFHKKKQQYSKQEHFWPLCAGSWLVKSGTNEKL